MFDYARKMQLAASDAGRRVALKAAAGVVAVIGAGFLLAALWTFLARNLGWGPLAASLVIGLVFVIAGVVLIKSSNTVNHPVPSTEELKAEVETRVSLAAEAATERARAKAAEVVDLVEHRVSSLIDEAATKVNAFADTAETRVHTLTRTIAGEAASKVGLTPKFFAEAQQTLDRVKDSNAATIPPLLGAFAVGVAIASKLQGWRHRDDLDDRYDDYDYADDDYDEFDELS